MERKTKHRILGVLVVIGLVVILLPFFQTSRELPSEKMLVKAPPFPEQTTQVAEDSIANDEIETNVATNATNIKPDTSQVSTPTESTDASTANTNQSIAATDEAATKIANQPEKLADKTTTTTVESKSPENIATVSDNKENSDENAEKVLDNKQVAAVDDKAEKVKPALSPLDDEPEPKVKSHSVTKIAANNKITKKEIKVAHATHFVPKVIEYKKITQHEVALAPISNNGLSQLKNSAWVIQLGSFKNKTNALRLVNQLRAKGYPAFIQQLDTAMGDTTRVFVGPEIKQTDARKTALHIANNFKLHGIVISYKPLTL